MPVSSMRSRKVGTGKTRGAPVLLIDNDPVAVSSATAAETTLKSTTLRGRTFFRNGVAVRFRATGLFAANGNNKQIDIYLDGTSILTTGVVTTNDKRWRFEGLIQRDGSNTQKAIVWGVNDTTNIAQTKTSLTKTDSGNLALTLKATAASGAGDVVCDSWTVEFLDDLS